MKSIDDLRADGGFASADHAVTFLPEPGRQPRRYTLISVDDHLVEPPDTFEGRLPSRHSDRAPRIEEVGGAHVWVFEGQQYLNIGVNAVAGRPVHEYSLEPTRFEHMRRGAWDIDARVADMDTSGVYASVCFPSFVGFAGQRVQLVTPDADLALSVVRAWNDWNIEAWSGPYPERMIPVQIPFLLDPEVGAEEIRRNAARGFKAVAFSEAPHLLGLPSLHSGHWDPLLRACAETGTVVNLHVGSAGATPSTAPDAPMDTVGALFFGYSMFATVDWLYSGVPVRYPDIKIALSEGGIGWVPALLDRLDHMLRYHEMFGTWTDIDLTPAEVVQRNFWFCALDDPSTFALNHRIGAEHVMVEEDFPHADSSWPYTQEIVGRQLVGLPADDLRRVTWENAAKLYRHEVPVAVQNDPDAF
jgi:predicted TIM-barrel fold metal-dependent hydrolase